MSTRLILAVVLICVGVLGLAYQGFTYTTRERKVDAGPIKVDVETTHNVPIAPVVGGVALAGGIALLLLGRRAA